MNTKRCTNWTKTVTTEVIHEKPLYPSSSKNLKKSKCPVSSHITFPLIIFHMHKWFFYNDLSLFYISFIVKQRSSKTQKGSMGRSRSQLLFFRSLFYNLCSDCWREKKKQMERMRNISFQKQKKECQWSRDGCLVKNSSLWICMLWEFTFLLSR